MRPKYDNNNYVHCEGDDCDFKSKQTRHLIYFKGRYLCFHCRTKASKCLVNRPTLNPKESTIIRNTRLPEGKSMPRERWKDYKKVTEPLKRWAERKEKESNIVVSLTPQEHKILWRHFYEQGLSDDEIDLQIEKIKANIRIAHEEYKRRLKVNKPSFKEEFEKLIEVKQ